MFMISCDYAPRSSELEVQGLAATSWSFALSVKRPRCLAFSAFWQGQFDREMKRNEEEIHIKLLISMTFTSIHCKSTAESTKSTSERSIAKGSGHAGSTGGGICPPAQPSPASRM